MPPKKKRPTRRATSPARAKTPARKPAARAKIPARKPAARSKTAARKPAARAKRPATPRLSERPRVALKPEEPEQPSGARPVAVGSVHALWETDEVAAPAPPSSIPAAAPAKESPSVVDKPLAELGAGVFAALLAASVFLPWYHNAPGTVGGWASGTWGPIIFFLSVAAVAVVVLRRAGIGIAFPVEPTLVVEAIGWVCVIGLILKRYFPPKPFGFKLPTDGWIFASLAFALGLALLAGVASSNAAFVLRPGWWKGAAGRIGAIVVVVALAGGFAFGFTNTAVSTAVPKIKENPPATVSKGMPPCAMRLHVPTPTGFTALTGSEVKSLNNCSIQFSSSLSLKTGFDRFVAALRGSGWTVTTGRSSAVYQLATLSGRTCGTLTTAQTQPKMLVTLVSLTACSQPAPK